MLLGAVDEEGSLLQSARFAFACLARPINQQRITHASVTQVRGDIMRRQCLRYQTLSLCVIVRQPG